MMENQGDIPEDHMKFARALIALAREHSMNNLTVEFDHSGSKDWETRPLNTPDRTTKTHFSWAEGRHGSKTQVSMVREERIWFKEEQTNV